MITRAKRRRMEEAASESSPFEKICALQSTETKAKRLVEWYFKQLTIGCGREHCANAECRSAAKHPLDSNAAALRSVELASKTVNTGHKFDCDSANRDDTIVQSPSESADQGSSSVPVNRGRDEASSGDDAGGLPDLVDSEDDEDDMDEDGPVPQGLTLAEVRATGFAHHILDTPGPCRHPVEVRDCTQALGMASESSVKGTPLQSKAGKSPEQPIPEVQRVLDLLPVFGAPQSLLSSFDSATSDRTYGGLDLEAVRQAYELLLGLGGAVLAGLKTSMTTLANALGDSVISKMTDVQRARLILTTLENPMLEEVDNRGVFGQLLVGICRPPVPTEVLASWLRSYEPSRFKRLLIATQQFLSMRSYMTMVPVHEDQEIMAGVRLLDAFNRANNERQPPFTTFDDMYNRALMDTCDLRDTYVNWREGQGFSLCSYPFILDSYVKSIMLHIESQVQMHTELRSALLMSLLSGPQQPYFVLKVRRDHVVEDTLNNLARQRDNLKKQLRVVFEGEEGVDEGGVQKEYFQLIVREIFDADYGMFVYDEEERLFWFNRAACEMPTNFELIGTVLGLALYNGVLLDVHFPMVVYKKLSGKTPVLDDLQDANPSMHRSFKQLLGMTAQEVEDLALTFQITFEDYGEIRTHDLKDDGGNLTVTVKNRQEYVDAYLQWLLVESVKEQYVAFERGFMRVCGGRALKLFRPEELELLICGSRELDFVQLEKATAYEDGYTKDSQHIKWFWEILHSMEQVQKKRFLAFATGSDRSPIRGLGTLRFVISQHGEDSDRLPSAHTCFNHLLLPAYSSREKMTKCLLMAIENAEGFGML